MKLTQIQQVARCSSINLTTAIEIIEMMMALEMIRGKEKQKQEGVM